MRVEAVVLTPSGVSIDVTSEGWGAGAVPPMAPIVGGTSRTRRRRAALRLLTPRRRQASWICFLTLFSEMPSSWAICLVSRVADISRH